MAYTKTTWINGTTLANNSFFINATNLNKMEQGIANASLFNNNFVIVDAAGGGDYTTLQAAFVAGNRNVYVKDGTYLWTSNGSLFDPTISDEDVTMIGESRSGVNITLDWGNAGVDGCLVIDATNQVQGAAGNSYTPSGATFTRTVGSWITDGFVVGMYVSGSDTNIPPFRVKTVTALTMTVEGLVDNIAQFVGTACSEVTQHISLDLIIKNVTLINNSTNFEWLTHSNSSDLFSAEFVWKFENIESLGNSGGHWRNDSFGFPQSFINCELNSLSDRWWGSPGTVWKNCYLNEAVFVSNYGPQVFLGCQFEDPTKYSTNSFNDQSTMIGCDFKGTIGGTQFDGILGETEKANLIGCSDENGSYTQSAGLDIHRSGSLTLIDLSNATYKLLPTFNMGSGVNGQKVDLWSLEASSVITFTANTVFAVDGSSGNTLTLTKGTGGLIAVQLLYFNQWYVIGNTTGGTGTIIASTV